MSVSETNLLSSSDMERAWVRIASEIVERNRGIDGLALVGVVTRGVPLAERLAREIGKLAGESPVLGSVDITLYRDDAPMGLSDPVVGPTDISFRLTGRTVVLVDDVLYTGRTIRAALDALMDLGRPKAVWLAVMVDRGHRELPIQADFVGKRVETRSEQSVRVRLEAVDQEECVVLIDGPGAS